MLSLTDFTPALDWLIRGKTNFTFNRQTPKPQGQPPQPCIPASHQLSALHWVSFAFKMCVSEFAIFAAFFPRQFSAWKMHRKGNF